jgi:conjugal transfer pilin signal peptidase TrbI
MTIILRNRLNILLATILILSLFAMIPRNYEFVINHSGSLPYNVVVIKKGTLPTAADQIFVSFVRDNPVYKSKEVKFIKLLGGKEGDEIKVIGRDISINDKVIGTAKLTSLKGDALTMTAAGKIPAHKFFAYTPHIDSYDSRYKEIGLIDEKDIIGTAIFAW